MYSPQIVCFCDIPLEDFYLHTQKYTRFGFSFSKDFIVAQGGTPVLYLPESAAVGSRGRGSSSDAERVRLADHFDEMVMQYQAAMEPLPSLIKKQYGQPGVPPAVNQLMEVKRFIDFKLLSMIKFFDHTLPDDHAANYYLEREWRVIGNVQFQLLDVRRILIPSDFARRLRVDLPEYEGQLSFLD